MIYLDHAASTPVKEQAREVLLESLVEDFANPSSAHKLGKMAMKKVEKARVKLLKMLGASKKDQLLFLSSATEANNLVIRGLELAAEDRVHYSLGDHPSTVNPVASLNSRLVAIELLSDGDIDEEKLLASLDENSKLIVLSHVNNQSGNIYQVETLAKKIKVLFPKIHIHVDGVQGFTKVAISLDGSIDTYTISGHKLGAPKGIGALYLKQGVLVEPQLLGGGHEFGLRSSTVNTPLILSLLCAVEVAMTKRVEELVRLKELNSFVRSELLESGFDISFPFPLEKTSPYILSFIFKGVSSDIILRHLEMKQIFVASSSACSSKAKGFNAGFAAMNIDDSLHKFVLRVSFNDSTTKNDLCEFIKEFKETITDIKRIL
ncbi:hypothetical protein A9Q84_09880 [Halobacteriovorax marinus]|uniref:Aminotransferase class V domain-containing protein n=1 Tax=Halobacteriovorax marinus TaxID=97084 RepID=A0A1Y5F772_9BACT|nr:hypothetical protein A9Q84_09880 [Halobacteriovorax marinus]